MGRGASLSGMFGGGEILVGGRQWGGVIHCQVCVGVGKSLWGIDTGRVKGRVPAPAEDDGDTGFRHSGWGRN